MTSKSTELAERRQHLVKRAAMQRMALAQNLEVWRAPLQLVDHGISLFTHFRRQPILLVGASLLIAALRWKRPRKWLRRGWLIWQVGRRLWSR
ncbi:MAG: YqjK-like family protein [Sulfuriferula sp.]